MKSCGMRLPIGHRSEPYRSPLRWHATPFPFREFSTSGAGQHKHKQTARRRRFWLLLTQEGKIKKKNREKNKWTKREEILNLWKKLSLKCGESCRNNWQIRKGTLAENGNANANGPRERATFAVQFWPICWPGPCPGQVDCGNCNWKTARGKTEKLCSHTNRQPVGVVRLGLTSPRQFGIRDLHIGWIVLTWH